MTDISIIIVNYNVKHFAEQCLRSIKAAQGDLDIEVLLVDNASEDGSVEYLRERFPEVIYISNSENIGFGRANNLALARAKGRYLLVLNPDTLLAEDSLLAMLNYMTEHPEAGVIGPKILTRYGTFDKTSKRGLPTPWVAFCRISGLAKLFPKSRLFGRYDLLYLDPDQPAQVDSLVGACMFVRREVYEQTQGFDEDYFMYGEDLDWSYRITQAGWQVHYAPVTKIVHFRGESTRRSSINRHKAFYGAMHLFVDKHFRNKQSWFSHQLINFGILVALLAARVQNVWSKVALPLIDFIGMWVILASARWLRTFPFWTDLGLTQWGEFGINLTIGFALTIQSGVWVGALAGFRVYGERRGQNGVLLMGILLGFLINSSFTYFFKQFAYSRFVALYGFILGGLFIWGWRAAITNLGRSSRWQKFLKRRALIVGVGEISGLVISRLREDESLPYTPVGLIDPEERVVGSLINGIPVLGGERDLKRLVEQERIEEILFANDKQDYDRMLELVHQIGDLKGINFKLITPEIRNSHEGQIPLLTVDYLMPRGFFRSLKKITSIAFKD